MKRLLLAVVFVLCLLGSALAQDAPEANVLEWPGLNIQGDVVILPFDGCRAALGAGMDMASLYSFIRLRLEAATVVTGSDDNSGSFIGPGIGVDIPSLVEKLGGQWILKGFTSSIGVVTLYDINDGDIVPGVYLSLIRIDF